MKLTDIGSQIFENKNFKLRKTTPSSLIHSDEWLTFETSALELVYVRWPNYIINSVMLIKTNIRSQGTCSSFLNLYTGNKTTQLNILKRFSTLQVNFRNVDFFTIIIFVHRLFIIHKKLESPRVRPTLFYRMGLFVPSFLTAFVAKYSEKSASSLAVLQNLLD